jgi:ribonuclease D
MYFDDGTCFVGRPEDANWLKCHARYWIMHNAAFDLTLFEALVEAGKVPDVEPRYVFDTADLAAYMSYPRSLKEASKHLLGIEMSKSTRDNMKGMKWTKDS